MTEIKTDHPKTVLYIRLTTKLTETVDNAFDSMLEELASKHTWTISPPEGMDYWEQEEWDESPVHIYGCALDMYSALPPWGSQLPKDIDLQHFNEASLLLDRIAKIAIEQGCDFEVQLDQTFMGNITPTGTGRGITEVFLGEWKKVLGLTQPT